MHWSAIIAPNTQCTQRVQKKGIHHEKVGNGGNSQVPIVPFWKPFVAQVAYLPDSLLC